MLLLVGTQAVFLRAGFYEDLGIGLVGDTLVLENYIEAFTDPIYLRSLLLTAYLSIIVVILSLLCAYPVAYVIARARSRIAMFLLAAIVVSSFITVVVKVLGLIIIFGADGPVNSTLRAFGLIEGSFTIVGEISGVAIGLMHYVVGFLVLLLFSVIQTIPRSLEEAAMIHGAKRWRTFWRVIFPLSLPGVAAGALIVFNLCMGAFVSAALLGGGKVLTLPVLIERTIVLDTKYAMAATLSSILLASVLAINVLSVFLVRKLRSARLAIT